MKDPIEKIVLKRALNSEWNFKDKEIPNTVQELLEEKEAHDIVFIIDNQRIPAHKDILSLRSSYFAKMFSSIILKFFH